MHWIKCGRSGAIVSLCLAGCSSTEHAASSVAGAGEITGVIAGRSGLGAAGGGGSRSASSTGLTSAGVSPAGGAAGKGAPDRGGKPEAGSGGMPAAGSGGKPEAGSGGMPAAESGGKSAAGSGGEAADPTDIGQIWMPKPGTTWQWQLTGSIDTNIDAQMYDIDLFTTSAATLQALHAAGRIVVCYFSAGSYEPDRPDSAALSKTGLGKTLDGWPDEKWLDIRSTGVRDLMKARLDSAKSKGCDGVEPDNVDGFDNDNGLDLTEQDALDYDHFLATESHARGLSIGLKNSLGLVSQLTAAFDWALNEECLKYDECDNLEPFIQAGKAVFHCEYGKNTNGICDKAPKGFSTIVKNLDLDAFRLPCE